MAWNGDPTLVSMSRAELNELREVAARHDPDVMAVYVLHGSSGRGLALSAWTSLTGPHCQHQALDLMEHALDSGDETDPP